MAMASIAGYQTQELSVVLQNFDGTEFGQDYLNLEKHQLVLELAREGGWACCVELQNHETGWAPAEYLKRHDEIPWHLTFALHKTSLMVQLVLPRCFYDADGRPVVKACNLGFPRPMKFDCLEKQYKFRRIHMSLSSTSSGWTSCEMAAFITRFMTMYGISFQSEFVHGRLWFTTKEPIISAKYALHWRSFLRAGVRAGEGMQEGALAYLDAGPMMDAMLIIFGTLGLVLKETEWPCLELHELHNLHVSCDP